MPGRTKTIPSTSDWRADVGRVLISRRRLERRVRELAARLEGDYAGRDLVLVPLLTGTLPFVADLMRHLDLPLRVDCLGISSYRERTRPGRLEVTKELRQDILGCDVLVVDDILDTGRTLHHVVTKLRAERPRTLRTCVLLAKRGRREIDVRADYVGFHIPDVYVIGYGLDHAERFRNLPYVAVLRTTHCAAQMHRRRRNRVNSR